MFFQLVATIFLVFASVGSVHLDPKIVGGKTVSTTKLLPHIVSIRTSDNVHFCTGAIINKYHLVTAASCFDDPDKNKPQDLLIYYDTTKSNGDEGSSTLAKSIIKHPKYNRELGLNDIAVISVKKRFYLTNLLNLFNDKRVKLGKAEEGQELVVGGWGSESEDPSDFGTHLKQLTLKVVPSDQNCVSSNLFFCAVGLRDGTVCRGDEGGPVVDVSQKRPALVGIVPKIGNDCISGITAKFTRIENYIGWINEQLGFLEKVSSGISDILPLDNILI